jgi:hypothetical protein
VAPTTSSSVPGVNMRPSTIVGLARTPIAVRSTPRTRMFDVPFWPVRVMLIVVSISRLARGRPSARRHARIGGDDRAGLEADAARDLVVGALAQQERVVGRARRDERRTEALGQRERGEQHRDRESDADRGRRRRDRATHQVAQRCS